MENTLKVFVLNMRGQPLMPCSPPKARKLLRAGKAVPVRRTPFVIQLTVPTGETKQPITLGVDAGYKHVGLSATTAKEELLASEVELRQDVTGLLSNRLAPRRARRNRKMRYRAPRFDNRVRSKHKGWLAPSVENRIQAHISRIEAVCQKEKPTKSKSEIIMEEAVRNPMQKEERANANPSVAKTDKSPLSRQNSEPVETQSDKGVAKPVEKPSVKEKLDRYKAQAKQQKEAERKEPEVKKDGKKPQQKNGQTVHRQPKKKPKTKER